MAILSLIICIICISCVTAFHLIYWLLHKTNHKPEKPKRLLPDRGSDVWTPPLPEAPIAQSIRARFQEDFRRLKEHEYISIALDGGDHITVDDEYRIKNGLLISPILDYAGDMCQQTIIDLDCINMYKITKQNVTKRK